MNFCAAKLQKIYQTCKFLALKNLIIYFVYKQIRYHNIQSAQKLKIAKKENLHSSEVLITINSERSKKVLLAQMVYDGSSITSSDNIEVPRTLTSRTSRIAADSLQQGCMSRNTISFAEMVYPIDILLSVITNLPLYSIFYNRVGNLVKIWHIHIR